MLLGLHWLDLTIILTSLIVLLAVGMWFSRGVSSETDFFVGGRKLGPVLQFFLSFGQMTDSNGAPIVASEVYRQGASGLWFPFQPIFATPFYWFSSIWWRRTRLITSPDQFIERFNSRRLALAIVSWGIVTAPLGGAMGNIVSYKVASAMLVKPLSACSAHEKELLAAHDEYLVLKKQFAAGTIDDQHRKRFDYLDSEYKQDRLPGSISYLQPIPFYLGYSAVVMVYILMGGIKAAAYTDAIQGLLIIVFSVILIPIGLTKVGGLHGLHEKVPPHMFELYGAEGVSDYTWYSIAAFVFLASISLLGSPGGCGTGRDEKAIRIGLLGGAFGKRLVMIAWMFCGLLAVALFPGQISDPENTWGVLSRELLGPGLLGLMISGTLLGHMPGVGAGAVGFSASFSRNLYQPLFPGRSDRHYMMVARLAIVGVLVAGIIGAMMFHGIIALISLGASLGAFFGATGLLMLFWRRLSSRAVGYGWVGWMAFLVILPYGLPTIPGFRTLATLTVQTEPRTVTVVSAATVEDVAAGHAQRLGQMVALPRNVPPTAVFFESVARQDSRDPNSPLEGIGRFHLENYLLARAGLPVKSMGVAGLNASRWIVDALGPFLMLIMLSYLLPERYPKPARPQSGDAGAPAVEGTTDTSPGNADNGSGTVALATTRAILPEGQRERIKYNPQAYASVVMNGNIMLLYDPRETAEEAEHRLNCFYAKLKTPIAPSPEEDEVELARSFANPRRFDDRKLFPGTSWEFSRWRKEDAIGFLLCWVSVFFILAMLWLTLNVG